MTPPLLYQCDPAKNIICMKCGCGFAPGSSPDACHATILEDFAALDGDGKPIPLPSAEQYNADTPDSMIRWAYKHKEELRARYLAALERIGKK